MKRTKRKDVFACSALLWSFVLLFPQTVNAQTQLEELGERLRNRIEPIDTSVWFAVQGERIFARSALLTFYERRAYRPAWNDRKGPLPGADQLLSTLRQADREGLVPADYHLAKVETILNAIQHLPNKEKFIEPEKLVALDLLLTDAFLTYAFHLLGGKIDPERVCPRWEIPSLEVDLAESLEVALRADRMERMLKGLLPEPLGYARLKKALAIYREFAAEGRWRELFFGRTLKRGDYDERVAALRERLRAEDFLGRKKIDELLFDGELEKVICEFQSRHGLKPEGVLDSTTVAALNISLEVRIRQIELNLERWRWLPKTLGKRSVLVNIAGFELEALEKERSVLKMRVVAGKEYRRTPQFSSQITYLVFNPHWYVPASIAVKDILPVLQKDPGYLARRNFKVLQLIEGELKEIDPDSVDWSDVSPKNFSYQFRQEPGPANALGRVKFMFSNRFNVYLHDTPQRELFAETERDFSSGCIRVEKPAELAEYLLRADSKWPLRKIVEAMEGGKTRTVPLPEPVPIHVLYRTAWVDEDGNVQFRNDIYRSDAELDLVMRERPPAP